MSLFVEQNQEKFEELRELSLPLSEYMIISSGPLGIRNIRQIRDVDLLVSEKLWYELATKYGIQQIDGVTRIVFPEVDIEAFSLPSFPDLDAKTLALQISQAEIIECLPFQPLEQVIAFKKKMNREKDLKDLALIDAWIQKELNI